MKSNEILAALPQWKRATADKILSSPAWAMPCRMGGEQCTMRLDELRPADTLDVSILLENETHTLSLCDSPRFPDLHALWAARDGVPEAILLALVEKECGQLLQLIENAVRRQLKISGLEKGGEASPAERLCFNLHFDGGEHVPFAITPSPAIVAALGQLRFVDTNHSFVRDALLSAEAEVASFVLPAEDAHAISIGDNLLLPEIGTSDVRLVADGRFVVDSSGVSAFSDDGRMRVVAADKCEISLGELFDAASGEAPSPALSKAAEAFRPNAGKDGAPVALRLVHGGRTVASGHLCRLAGIPAMFVESKE